MKINIKIKNIIEKIQLSFFYLFYMLLNIEFAKEPLSKRFFLIQKNLNLNKLLSFKIFKLLNAPKRSIFLHMFCNELFLRRDVFNTSTLVKFNVILFCMITMLNNLILSYWDLCFRTNLKELDFPNSKYSIPFMDDTIYFIIFVFSLMVYTYTYLYSLIGIIPKGPIFLRPIFNAANFAVNRKRIKNKENNI